MRSCSHFLVISIILVAQGNSVLNYKLLDLPNANSAEKHGKIVSKRSETTSEKPWTGRWLPERTTKLTPTTERVSSTTGGVPWTGRWLPEHTTQKVSSQHGTNNNSSTYNETDFSYLRNIPMGQASSACDDAKTNLSVDWYDCPVNFTCYKPLERIEPNYNYPSLLHEDLIPPGYTPIHKCMDSSITYDENIPTYGDHRPLWPMYGEYKFVPKQRWLHNIEHGAVVMLYHPCAHPVEVSKVRKILTGCIRKHIITPDTLVEEDRPIVLVAWGAKLSMAWADADVIRNFIRKYSLKGPEGHLPSDGQYSHLLEVPAAVPSGSDYDDKNICPGQWV